MGVQHDHLYQKHPHQHIGKGIAMRGSKIGLALCFLPLIGSLAGGESISWIDGTFGPTGWSISPLAPTSGDVVNFSGPTTVYGNACAGEMALGGSPQLWIDHFSHVIEVRFQPPAPALCALIFQPVSGLKGDFGPLGSLGHPSRTTASLPPTGLAVTFGARLTHWWTTARGRPP